MESMTGLLSTGKSRNSKGEGCSSLLAEISVVCTQFERRGLFEPVSGDIGSLHTVQSDI